MCVVFNHIYFRPKISATCFKIPFSISSCLTCLRRLINSNSSSVRLSFLLKEPVELDYLIHLSSKEDETSYSRTISNFRFPFR